MTTTTVSTTDAATVIGAGPTSLVTPDGNASVLIPAGVGEAETLTVVADGGDFEVVGEVGDGVDARLEAIVTYDIEVGGADGFTFDDELATLTLLVPSTPTTDEAFDKATLAIASHFHHEPTDLTLSPFRAHDSSLGRWLSEDPNGFGVGYSLYAYVGTPQQA